MIGAAVGGVVADTRRVIGACPTKAVLLRMSRLGACMGSRARRLGSPAELHRKLYRVPVTRPGAEIPAKAGVCGRRVAEVSGPTSGRSPILGGLVRNATASDAPSQSRCPQARCQPGPSGTPTPDEHDRGRRFRLSGLRDAIQVAFPQGNNVGSLLAFKNGGASRV